MTVRASASRLAALVLLLSMLSPFLASASPADPFAATTRVESASNEAVALDALIAPLVSPFIQQRAAAARLEASQIVTKMRTRTDHILRL